MQPLPHDSPADPHDERRFGGLARLYGSAGAARIRTAHVAVVGVGGVGSWSAEALARSGVGRITLFDLDHVAESNVNRQIHAVSATLGQAKVDAMGARMSAIHPCGVVHAVDDFVTPDNWAGYAAAGFDAVIDACDQVRAKLSLAAWALTRPDVVFISVGAAGGKQRGELVEVADLNAVTHDPLLAKLRYELRRRHGAARSGRIGVHAVFSREPVAQPDSACASSHDGSLNCHGYGSTVAVTATFGMCAAGWVMQKLARAS